MEATVKSRVEVNGWAADIEAVAQTANRIVAFVLAMQRLNACSFAKEIDQISFSINTKYAIQDNAIQIGTWFTHPAINVEAFESFALRLRPIIYDRDVCNFKDVISDARSIFADCPAALSEFLEIERLFNASDLNFQLSKMEVLSAAAASSPWPVLNLWNVVFGGNLWMRQDIHDELFLYGFLYHWNSKDDKWREYRRIEEAAGGRENVLRCMIPFFQHKYLAVSRLEKILVPTLRALGLSREIDTSSESPIIIPPDNSAARSEIDVAPSERTAPLDSETPNQTGTSVLDVHAIIRSLLPGQHLIERHSWRFRDGKMKRKLSLEGEGIQPPQVQEGNRMTVAPAGIMLDFIPAGETSITLEATPYIPPQS
jgi:hypothetical protein